MYPDEVYWAIQEEIMDIEEQKKSKLSGSLEFPLIQDDLETRYFILKEIDEIQFSGKSLRKDVYDKYINIKTFSEEERSRKESIIAQIFKDYNLTWEGFMTMSDLIDGFPDLITSIFSQVQLLMAPETKYRQILRFGESLLAFLANLSIMSYIFEAKQLPKIKDSQKLAVKLQMNYQKGASPGDWVDFLRTNSKLLKILLIDGHKNRTLPNGLIQLSKGKGTSSFHNNIQRFVELKNDFKHDRYPNSPEEFNDAWIEIKRVIRSCLRGLNFLTKVTITTGDGNTGSRMFLTVDAENYSLPLYPFIIFQKCDQCDEKEIFYIERINYKTNIIVYKSFKTGHVKKTKDASVLKELINGLRTSSSTN